MRFSFVSLPVVPAAVVCLTLVAALGGCPMTNIPEPADPNAISFSRDVQPILDARCTSCHQTNGFADLAGIDLRLTSDVAVAHLLNMRSVEDADQRFVTPGDPNASLLVTKIESGPQPFGSRMPLFSSRLSDTQIQTIRAWITQGAQDN
ncbi:MAG: c-type cytochrome [Phycisphaerales bacterium]|nr:c-type cytochrome [Phycisphaerales bacterium]MCA9270974.1 c-type cytochrome [Planctomycetales bacterium]